TMVALMNSEAELRRDPAMRKQLEQRAKELDECSIPEIKRIRKTSLRITGKVVAINAGGWAIYIVPLIWLRDILSRTVTLLKRLVLLPETEFERVMPSRSNAGTVAC